MPALSGWRFEYGGFLAWFLPYRLEVVIQRPLKRHFSKINPACVTEYSPPTRTEHLRKMARSRARRSKPRNDCEIQGVV